MPERHLDNKAGPTKKKTGELDRSAVENFALAKRAKKSDSSLKESGREKFSGRVPKDKKEFIARIGKIRKKKSASRKPENRKSRINELSVTLLVVFAFFVDTLQFSLLLGGNLLDMTFLGWLKSLLGKFGTFVYKVVKLVRVASVAVELAVMAIDFMIKVFLSITIFFLSRAVFFFWWAHLKVPFTERIGFQVLRASSGGSKIKLVLMRILKSFSHLLEFLPFWPGTTLGTIFQILMVKTVDKDRAKNKQT